MQRNFHGAGAFKQVEEFTFWVLQNKKGQFYTQFELTNKGWILAFTDKIQSATSWPSKKRADAGRKETAWQGGVQRKALKPIKVLLRKTISYDVM